MSTEKKPDNTFYAVYDGKTIENLIETVERVQGPTEAEPDDEHERRTR